MSVVALSIDSILPAMGYIRHKFAVQPEDGHWILTALFFGLAVGQIIFGPLSDTIGRKPTIYLGMMIFTVGSLLSYFASEYWVFILGRIVQGFGVAAPRIVSQAIIRDVAAGPTLARVNSFVMSVFIAVPVFAPILGQIIIWTISWDFIFLALIIYCTTLILIFRIKIKETLTKPRKFDLSIVFLDCAKVFSNRITFGSMVAIGCVFGCLISFLNIAQPLYQEVYKVGDQFALYFAGTAIIIGVASLLNAKLVGKIHIDLIVGCALIWTWVWSAAFLVIAIKFESINLMIFLFFSALVFTPFGFLFSNLNAIAMEPMGQIAGTASAIIATVSNIIALSMGAISTYFFSDSPTPLMAVFLINATFVILLMIYLKRLPFGKFTHHK